MDRQIIAIDFDGVLTDGKKYIGTEGSFYSVNSRDNVAIAQLISDNYDVVIVTANNDPVIQEYAKKRKCRYLYSREKDIEATYAIGDSTFDIPMLIKAQYRFCPKNSHYRVKMIPGMRILDINGGDGVIENFLMYL